MQPSELTVPLVDNGDGTWGSPNPAWDHLITRESSGNPTIIQQIVDVNSGGNEAEGLFQITPATWRAHNGTEFARSARLATPQQQAIVAARILTANPSGSDWGAGRPGREDGAQLLAGLVPATPTPPGPLARLAAVRPDFNEYPVWSGNSESRAGTIVDLWLLHTEEGDMNADALARWLDRNGVSYHYTGSQAPDGGSTVCDVVDTDLASWSVLGSNHRAINAVVAGSYAGWTPLQWQSQTHLLEAYAYLAVQDSIKYPGLVIGVAGAGGTLRVIPPPYKDDPPGISDHRYCTQHLRDGNTHVDVGDNFPWTWFAERVAYYWSVAFPTSAPPPPPPPPPPPNPPNPIGRPAIPQPADAKGQTADIWVQLLTRYVMLGGRTPVEALAAIGYALKIAGFQPGDPPAGAAELKE